MQFFRNLFNNDRPQAYALPFSFWRTETPDTVIERLERLPDINQHLNPDYPGLPIHHAASTSCAITVMCKILDLGGYANARNHNNNTPLHLYAQNGNNPAVVELLIARGANLYAKNDLGLIPLETAVAWHNGPIADAIARHHQGGMPSAWRAHLSFMPPILPPETYLWDYRRSEKDDIISEYHRQASLARHFAMPIEVADLPPVTDSHVNMIWERVLGSEKDSPFYWANRGYAGFILNHEEDYQKCLHNAITIEPLHPQNYITLGFIKAMAGENDAALDFYYIAISIDSQRPDAYDLRATVYQSLGQPERAIDDIYSAIELGAVDVAGCYTKIAWSKLMLGDRQGAISAVDTALTINPDHIRAQEMLMRLLVV